MNPQLWRWLLPDAPVETRAEIVETVPSPAVAFDRAYIAELPRPTGSDMLIYQRTPLVDEWPGDIPADAAVVVYVINDWTIVRTLQDASGTRLGEPILDSWLHHPMAAAA